MLLPFVLGRNLVEITLLNTREIQGYSIFDVVYFFPIYVSDIFLLLIFQNYISNKLSSSGETIKLSKNYYWAIASFIMLIFVVSLRSLSHEFGYLIVLSSIILVKFLLIYCAIPLIDIKKHADKIYQCIAANTFFQAGVIIVEQIRRGNLGLFIEKTLPGMEIATRSSETRDIIRANGTFNEPNIAAIFLLINFCIVFSYALKNIESKKIRRGYLYLLISLISLLALVFTGSRSIYLVTFFAVIYYFLNNKETLVKLFSKLWQLKSIKIAITIAIIASAPYLFNRADTIRDVFNDRGGLSYRNEINRYTLLLSQKSILGVGINLAPYYLAINYKTADSNFAFDVTPAHNIFIQLYTETGIFGLISIVLFIYFALKDKITLRKSMTSFTIASIVFLVAAQFHPAFTSHPEIFSFFMLYSSLANSMQFETL